MINWNRMSDTELEEIEKEFLKISYEVGYPEDTWLVTQMNNVFDIREKREKARAINPYMLVDEMLDFTYPKEPKDGIQID